MKSRAPVAYRVVVLGAGLIVAGLLLEQLVTLVMAAMLTLILSLPLSAAASRAERDGLPRALGALTALFSLLTVGVGIGSFVVPQFFAQARRFAERLPSTVAGVERYAHSLTGVTSRALSSDASHVIQSYTQHPQRLLGPLATLGLGVVGLVVATIVVLLAAVYIAVDPEPLGEALLALLPADRRPQALRITARVRTAWAGWLLAIGIDMVLLGTLLYAGMSAVGLDFALGFAVFSALMTVIPNYGSIISAVPPVLLGLAQSPGKGLLVLGVYVLVNQIEGNLILPLVMARTVDLHPALVSIGVLVTAQLFGLLGVVIAIPLLSLTIILVDELWVSPHEGALVKPQTEPRPQ